MTAKKQAAAFEASPEKSDGEKNSEIDLESDKLEFKEQVLNKAFADSLVNGNEKKDSLKEEVESPKMDNLPTIKIESKDAKFQHPGDNVDVLVKRKVEDSHETKAQILLSNKHSNYEPTKVWEGVPKVPMGDIQANSYPVAGPSNYNCNLNHISSEGVANRRNIEGSDRVELLEQDRAELLRKLDELRDQIKQSCEVVDAPKERVPVLNSHGYNGKGSWFPDGSSTLNHNLHNVHNMDMPRFYPAPQLHNGGHGYRETSRPYSIAQPFNLHGQYPPRPSNG